MYVRDIGDFSSEERITWQGRLKALMDEYQSMNDDFFSQGYQTLELLQPYFKQTILKKK